MWTNSSQRVDYFAKHIAKLVQDELPMASPSGMDTEQEAEREFEEVAGCGWPRSWSHCLLSLHPLTASRVRLTQAALQVDSYVAEHLQRCRI